MYFFDPDRGNSRRALVRDKAIGVMNDMREDVNVMVQDFQNRSKGLMHDVRKDGIGKVVERVRSGEESPMDGGRMQPAVCLLVGSAGLMMTLMGFMRRGVFGGAMATVGVGLIAKSFMDTEGRFDPSPRKQCEELEAEDKVMPTPKAKTRSRQSQATVQ